MNKANKIIVIALSLIIASASNSFGANIYALLHVEKPQVVWNQPDLTAKLLDRLSGYRGVEFEVIPDSNWQTSQSGSNYVSSDYLARFGSELRARYVISLENLSETIETRKGLSIPLLLSRYSQVAVLRGTMRIIDSEKGRMVVQEDFEITYKSRSQWQVFEDAPITADLRTEASDKDKLFASLEWRAAEELSSEIFKIMKLK